MAVGGGMSAGTRRLLYGFNVVFSAVLILVLVSLLMWVAGARTQRIDLTSGGVNTLSPRTKALLRDLKTDVRLTGIYTQEKLRSDPFSDKRYRRVRDLLTLYENAGRGTVESHMIDFAEDKQRVAELLERLSSSEVFQEEAGPHKEALASYEQLVKQLVDFAQQEQARLESIVQADANLQSNTQLNVIQRGLRTINERAQQSQRNIQQLLEGDVPQWGAAVDATRSFVEEQALALLEQYANWLSTAGAELPGISPAAQRFFAGAQERYQQVLQPLRDYIERTRELSASLTLEEIYTQLQRPQSILVEAGGKAEVLSLSDVWPFRADPQAPPPEDDDPRDFLGEQAISSAILRLTQDVKPAAVFVYFGGQSPITPDFRQMQQMGRPAPAPFQELAQTLRDENFEVAEWNALEQSAPPETPEADRRVFIVLPPTPPRPRDPRQPPPQVSDAQKQAVTQAIEQAGAGLFLAQWEQPSPMRSGGAGYGFNAYVQDWGIAVDADLLVMEFQASPTTEGYVYASPGLITNRVLTYGDHPIVDPLRGVPSALAMTAPLEMLDAREGTRVTPLLSAADSEFIWALTLPELQAAEQAMRRREGIQRPTPDEAGERLPPFPLAVAAERDVGEGENAGTQRLVVFGSSVFAADAVAGRTQLTLTSGGLQMALAFPGNADLFLNSVHWLTGNANRIAVGPQRSAVPRLDRLKDRDTATAIKVFLVAVWPSLALIVGGVVWFVRRR